VGAFLIFLAVSGILFRLIIMRWGRAWGERDGDGDDSPLQPDLSVS